MLIGLPIIIYCIFIKKRHNKRNQKSWDIALQSFIKYNIKITTVVQTHYLSIAGKTNNFFASVNTEVVYTSPNRYYYLTSCAISPHHLSGLPTFELHSKWDNRKNNLEITGLAGIKKIFSEPTLLYLKETIPSFLELHFMCDGKNLHFSFKQILGGVDTEQLYCRLFELSIKLIEDRR